MAFLRFSDGYINYSYNYRSSIDTPFKESSLSQHFITGYASIILGEKIPLKLTFFGRQTNSQYFRDYRDIRVEFNQAEFKQLQARKIDAYLKQVISQETDPLTLPSLNYVENQLSEIQKWMNGKEMVNNLIQARRVILIGGEIDSANFTKDTSLQKAKQFLEMYAKLEILKKKLGSNRDSLAQAHLKAEKLFAIVKSLSNPNISKEDREKQTQTLASFANTKFKKLEKLIGRMSSIRNISIGKVIPNHSDLTLKNVNITGVNFEYYNKIYFAFSAGAVDYRARDFIKVSNNKPQFVYLAKLGYGARQASHFHFTAFKGKRQLLNSGHNPRSLEIYGLSAETQILLHKNHRFLAELAQSAAPGLISQNGQFERASFKFQDEKNKAWTVKLNSDYPKTGSKLELYYKYRGINFQSFSSYYSNANQKSWQVKANQYLWKRQIRLAAIISKNSFENSELPVRYNGETLFTSFTLHFKRKKWPSLQIGYMPSSQLSEVNGVIFENFYHTLNLSVNHQYKIGLATAYSLFSFNQFYNNSLDTGFIYYNARNYYFSQLFQFTSFGATLNISQSKSRNYSLTVIESGLDIKVGKKHKLGAGAKVNQLNNASVRLGFYGSTRLSVPKLGDFSVWVEKSYLPGWDHHLIRNELFHIGYTRFFN